MSEGGWRRDAPRGPEVSGQRGDVLAQSAQLSEQRWQGGGGPREHNQQCVFTHRRDDRDGAGKLQYGGLQLTGPSRLAQCIRRLQLSPFIFHKDAIHGFVYDVDTGVLHPVDTLTRSS